MNHSQLHAIDLAIIGAYLIAMIVIGLVVVKKIKNTDDYYLGGRSFGPLVLMATVCATIIGGSGLMGRAGVAYSSGFKAIMTAVPYLLGMLIFSGFAGRISAVGTSFNITSIPDLFERRFGKATKVTLGALIAFTMMGTVAAQVTATATIINMLGGEIGVSYEMGALIACAVFIIYTATSGLFGVIYTDVFQFVMLILFVYILIPGASLVKLGGPAAFFPQSRAGAGDALRRRHDPRGYHHLLCVHARRRGDVAARLCGEKPEGGKERAVSRDRGIRAYDPSRVVHGRCRAPAHRRGKDRHVRNHRRRRSGACH